MINSVVDNTTSGISWYGSKKQQPEGIGRYGKRFEPNATIRHIKADEGDLIIQGRFGSSINLGHTENNNTSSLLKIRSGQRTDLNTPINDEDNYKYNAMKLAVQNDGPIYEDINEDKNSIYLSTHGKHTITNTNPKYDNKDLIAEGNCIILNSDKLIFNARDGDINIRAAKKLTLEADTVFINAKKTGTINMGDPRGVFMPTIDAMVMMEFLTEVMDVLNKGFAAIGKATNPAGLLSAAKDIATIVAKQIPRILEILTEQLFFNKSVMVQDPRFILPELPFKIPKIPEVPKIEIPKVPELKIPEIPDLDMEELKAIEGMKNLKNRN